MKPTHITIKSILITGLLFLFFIDCEAQQEILYSQYLFSQLAVNPAYAGNNVNMSFSAISRKQWIGLDGSPTSIMLFGDGAILGRKLPKERNFHKDRRSLLFSDNKQIGLGLVLFNDRLGVNNTLQASASYSYKICFNSYTRLSFGLQTSILNFNQGFDKLENIDSDDEEFRENINISRFNVGSGVFFETEYYFVGLSVPSMIKNNLDPENPDGEKQLRQYFVTAGYLVYLHPLVKLKPTMMVRYTENMPTQVDMSLHIMYSDRIWTGISYRHRNSFNVFLEMLLTRSVGIGLAYDIPLGEIRTINYGSAEVLISYTLQPPKKRVINPRYF